MIIDRFQYTYDLSCRKDSATGQYCDEIFVSWLNGSRFTSAQNCSDCMLGVVQIQLNSPFGYDDDFAEQFASTTASCGKSEYTFTSPAAYAINSTITAPADPSATPPCSQPYQVQAGDTCDSIATLQGVSTYAIIQAGALRPDCSNLLAGSSLCLPESCDVYRVQPGDTCDTILAAHSGLTGVHLAAWNPNLNSICGNIDALVDSFLCVSAPGSLGQVTVSTSLPVSTATEPAPVPTNAHQDSNTRCVTWYTVQEGDYCQAVSIRQGISLQDFHFLNPQINEECTNLWLGTAYCVQAVGDIRTYSGYPSTSEAYTLTSASYTTTTSTLPASVPAIITPIVPSPTAPGTLENCEIYVEHFPVPPLIEQVQSPTAPTVTDMINSCNFILASYDVPLEDFLSWNPSLYSVDPCALQEGFRYCAINATDDYIYEQEVFHYLCETIESPVPGTVEDCTCFTTVTIDYQGWYLCEDIASDAKITLDELMLWNPWIGSDCDTNMFTGMNEEDMRPYHTVVQGDTCYDIYTNNGITFSQFYEWNPAVGPNCESMWLGYAYCVEAPGSSSSPPAPVREGTPTDCTQYHVVVSGDACWAIAEQYGIDFATLYAWNPSVGSNCEALWLDYALCVAGGPSP
ncbi:hypothetical protein DV735_g3659, partial [Chaetothyriales sp. CBS 134920]